MDNTPKKKPYVRKYFPYHIEKLSDDEALKIIRGISKYQHRKFIFTMAPICLALALIIVLLIVR